MLLGWLHPKDGTTRETQQLLPRSFRNSSAKFPQLFPQTSQRSAHTHPNDSNCFRNTSAYIMPTHDLVQNRFCWSATLTRTTAPILHIAYLFQKAIALKPKPWHHEAESLNQSIYASYNFAYCFCMLFFCMLHFAYCSFACCSFAFCAFAYLLFTNWMMQIECFAYCLLHSCI